MAKSRKPAAKSAARLYTLKVALIGAPLTPGFAKKNPIVARTIQVRGDQTLEDLHHAIFGAFDREDEHMYEFQFGEQPMERNAPRYVLPLAMKDPIADMPAAAGSVRSTTLDALKLAVDRAFFYWFDFGDDWMHQITVVAVEDKAPKGKYPKVVQRVGASPPQYADFEEEEEEELEEEEAAEEEVEETAASHEIPDGAAADVSCLIGEQHLRDGEYQKAVEAFTRSLESRTTADAHEGRARAYRALADDDDRRALSLR
jgi:hypothetical protein